MKVKRLLSYILTTLTLCCSLFLLASCDDDMGSQEVPNEPYVLSLGITSNGTTTYYATVTINRRSRPSSPSEALA